VIRRILVICLFGAFLMVAVAPAQANGAHSGKRGGFLFVGTDTEEFGGAVSADRLGRFQTRGPNVVGGGIIATAFPINGMTDAHGFLYSGDPRSNVIRRITYDGSLLGSTVAAIPAACCSEDMILDGRFLYHAHYPSTIEKINASTGALVQTYAQPNVVGMTFVTDDDDDDGDHHGGKEFARFDLTEGVVLFDHGDNDDRQIWITKWSARQVGTWDPATNTFTPRFATPPGRRRAGVGFGEEGSLGRAARGPGRAVPSERDALQRRVPPLWTTRGRHDRRPRVRPKDPSPRQ
jgi:hypothetical protein